MQQYTLDFENRTTHKYTSFKMDFVHLSPPHAKKWKLKPLFPWEETVGTMKTDFSTEILRREEKRERMDIQEEMLE